MNDDPYVQDNGVMINLLGLRDGRALAKAEANLTRRRIFQLLKTPLPGTFDFAHLCEIHKTIFQDCFPQSTRPGARAHSQIGERQPRYAHRDVHLIVLGQRCTATSDAGLVAYRELDDALGLSTAAGEALAAP